MIRRSTYTTGEAAAFCGCSQQTIIRICDAGILKCFKIPGSRHRRILPAALREFMKANGIPIGLLDEHERKVVPA